MSVDQEKYQKNIDFWDTAWSRVGRASTRIPPKLTYIPTIPEHFKKHNCSKILDIACGSGWLSFFMAENGLEATGLDISEKAIQLAHTVLEKNSEANVEFKVGDMMKLDFPENHFDGLLVNAAFEHLDYQRGKEFLEHVKTVIKPGGIMFGVFDKVATGEQGTFDVLEDGTHQYKDEFRDGMFIRYYSDDELKTLFDETGWKVLSNEKNDFESRIVIAQNEK